MTDFVQNLINILPAEVSLSQETAEILARHWQLVEETNRSLNLTAIRDEAAAIEKHYLDSLLLLPFLAKDAKVLDIGSGAGFPGMPLAIARPDCRVFLLEATAKRCAFMRKSIETLNIPNAQVVEARAEKAGRDLQYRENFDIVTARAVTALPALLEYCLPFLKVGGIFLAMKGPSFEAELSAAENALKVLGGEYLGNEKFDLPGGDERRILKIRKIAPCGEKYPRREGMPEKRPL